MKPKSLMIALLGMATFGATAYAAQPAQPGTVNYIEGTASLDGQTLNNKSVGNVVLQPGQELSTTTGKAEILLTPGVFLRVGDNSEVKMVSPDLTRTQIDLEKGRAGVEVDEIHDQNNLQVIEGGVTTQLEKTGYYEFNADQPAVMVYKGKAKAEVADGKWREIKSHHELALNGGTTESVAKEKPADFNTKATDDLYSWSKLRSQYLSEANNQIAGEYAGAGYYPGWYPYGWGYTYIGAGPFYSPFGWGFYPFGYGGLYGGYGGYYGGRVYRGGYYQRYGRGGELHGGVAHGGVASGFHGGAAGGFHGGAAGGFHGGMGGGGFHGGGGGRGR